LFVSVLAQDYDIRNTSNGQVRGIVNGSICREWRGIPFAADTGGKNRWLAPQPRATWSPNVFDATNFGPGCAQIHHNPDVPTIQSEDCLNVNVFAPYKSQAGDNLAVMIWYHGGTFDEGWNEGPFDLYDGCNLAHDGNVIVVTSNYRLGALGYLVTDTLRGNFGFLDQRAAMKWVQGEIYNFGGDKNHVTIWGQSAGSMSVGLHFLSPNSYNQTGLFQQVIMESNFPATILKTLPEAEILGLDFCADDNIQCLNNTTKKCDVNCMRNKTLSQVQQAWRNSEGSTPIWIIDNFQHLLDGLFAYGPVIDGIEIPGQIIPQLRLGAFDPKISILFGTNTGEGQTFIYYLDFPLPYDVYEDAVKVAWYPDGDAIINYYKQFFPPPMDGRKPLSQITTDYLFRCSSQVYGNEMIKRGGKAWNYRFDHLYSSAFLFPLFGLPEICANVTCHAEEIPFVFNNTVPSLNATFTPAEYTLIQRMNSYWISFVKYGDPNMNKDQINWLLYDPITRPDLLIQTPNVQIEYDSVNLCEKFWDPLGYDH